MPGSAAEKTKNSFAQAFELMKHIQSNSLQAWEISDAEFQLLKSQHTQSIDRMLRNLGQQVSESGEVLDQNANPSCLRCSDNVKLEEAVGTDEFDDYYNFARKTPEVFYNGNATYAGVDDFLQKKGVPLADQPAIRKIMESINFITHDARLRIRFIRWFFEYAKNRVLRLDHYEVISHESHPVVGQPFALSIHAIGNHGQIMTDHHGEVTMFVVGDDDAKFPLKEIHLSQGVAHLTPRNIASGEVVIQGGVTLSHATDQFESS